MFHSFLCIHSGVSSMSFYYFLDKVDDFGGRNMALLAFAVRHSCLSSKLPRSTLILRWRPQVIKCAAHGVWLRMFLHAQFRDQRVWRTCQLANSSCGSAVSIFFKVPHHFKRPFANRFFILRFSDKCSAKTAWPVTSGIYLITRPKAAASFDLYWEQFGWPTP